MNILFVSAVFPYPLVSGGQIRIYNLLKRLSKKHTITLLSFVRDNKEGVVHGKELAFLTHLATAYRGKALQFRYLLGSLGMFSWLLATYQNKKMETMIRQELQKNPYDLVHIEPFYVFPSLPPCVVPVVIGEHNIEYAVYEQYARSFRYGFLRPLLRWDVAKTRFWERRFWKKAAQVTVVSQEDASVIQKAGQENVSVVPNGVDCSLYTYKKPVITERHLRCLFVGDFAWIPNRNAVEQLVRFIWPVIEASYPHASLTIVGKQFPGYLNQYCSKQVSCIAHAPDMRAVYDAHDILLAPMDISGGSKFKLLEAFASGLVVITTPAGKQGIAVANEIDYLEARTPKEYLAAIHALVNDPVKAQTISRHARDTIEKKYTWDMIAEQLDAVWRRCV